MSKTEGLNFVFTEEQKRTIDNALDMLYERGYEEIKHQPAKMIGDQLLEYSVCRVTDEVKNPKHGDILVKAVYRAGRFTLSFWRPGVDGIDEIPAKDIIELPLVNAS